MLFSCDRTPIGTALLDILTRTMTARSFRGISINRVFSYKLSVFVLTYVAYTAYHLSRKSLSVVKSVLHPNHVLNTRQSNGWPPFDTVNGPSLLGLLDTSFLIAYAIGMFCSGMLAERCNLRYYLTLGMLGSGVCSVLMGFAHYFRIHSLAYFVAVQIAAGLMQTTGWPAVVAVMGNWFGDSKKGLIFGVWNSHTSLGNILGNVIAGAFVDGDWALSFIYPGLIVGVVGFIVWLFLVPDPEDIGLSVVAAVNVAAADIEESLGVGVGDGGVATDGKDVVDEEMAADEAVVWNDEDGNEMGDRQPILRVRGGVASDHYGFCEALRLPGVCEYSLCLFFAKLVSYTFLFWLPLYINKTTKMDASASAYVAVLFDVGGASGGLVAGIVRDWINRPASTCSSMLLISLPLMYYYQQLPADNTALNMAMLFAMGFFINGPYALITTTISTDLATQHQQQQQRQQSSNRQHRSAKCLAIVSAIIDGTGSIGAILGPFFTGYLNNNWPAVFAMLIASNFLSVLFLVRIMRKECRATSRGRGYRRSLYQQQ